MRSAPSAIAPPPGLLQIPVPPYMGDRTHPQRWSWSELLCSRGHNPRMSCQKHGREILDNDRRFVKIALGPEGGVDSEAHGMTFMENGIAVEISVGNRSAASAGGDGLVGSKRSVTPMVPRAPGLRQAARHDPTRAAEDGRLAGQTGAQRLELGRAVPSLRIARVETPLVA